MPSLSDLVPEITAYQQAQTAGQQQQMGQLQQMGALQSLLQGPLKEQLLRAQIAEHQQAPELKRLQIANTKEAALARLDQSAQVAAQTFALRMRAAKTAEERLAVEKAAKMWEAGYKNERLKYDTGATMAPLDFGTAPQQSGLPSFQNAMGAMGGRVNAPFTIETDPNSPQPVTMGQPVAAPPMAAPAQAPSAPVAAPVQAPNAAVATPAEQMPPEIARMPKKVQDQWRLAQAKKDPGKAYLEAAGRAAAKDDVSQHDAAIAAAADLPKINNLVNTIKTSQAVTGLGADLIKNIERAKVLLANDKKAGKVVSDTEYLDALMGSEVFAMIKPLGIGARGLDTPAEREFLRKVMTGELSLNKETLLRMAETRKAITERAVDRWNSRVRSGELDDYFKGTKRTKQELPTNPPPITQQESAPAPAPSGGTWKITPIQ